MGAKTEAPEKLAEERPSPRPTTSSLTQDQFLSWKRQKPERLVKQIEALASQDAASSARKAEASRKRAEDIAAGTVQMNGRELFLHEPSVFDNSRY